MTVKWNCKRCGKVVGYVDQNRQVQEAIEDPDQFCECPEEEMREDGN